MRTPGGTVITAATGGNAPFTQTPAVAFYRIVLPLVVPALMAVALFAVTNAWNEFLFAFIFIQSNEATTLPVGLGRLVVGDVFAWGPIMAASVVVT